jgi:hypothetical protein
VRRHAGIVESFSNISGISVIEIIRRSFIAVQSAGMRNRCLLVVAI